MSSTTEISRRQALGRVGALLGGIVSAPTVAGVLSGCERISGPNWTPQALTDEQNQMVTAIAEIIIPTTDTPGAAGARVNRFIDAMLHGSYPTADRDRFLNGLDAVNTRCEDSYGSPFLECTPDQKRALVADLDDETFGNDADSSDRENPSFFRMMKELTIVGYYTSEVGGRQELKTNVAPGRYDGSVPYEEIGRAWA